MLGDIWQCLETFWFSQLGSGCDTIIQDLGVRDAADILQCTAQPHHTKNSLAPSANNAMIENPCSAGSPSSGVWGYLCFMGHLCFVIKLNLASPGASCSTCICFGHSMCKTLLGAMWLLQPVEKEVVRLLIEVKKMKEALLNVVVRKGVR